MGNSGLVRAVSFFLATAVTAIAFAQAPAAPPAAPAVGHKEIKLSHEKLARLVGTYEVAPQANMSITLEGEQLQAQLSGQPKVEVFAESETMFFLKVVDAQVEFKLDAAGAVTALVLHQAGRDMEARRTSVKVVEHKETKLAADVLALYPGTYAGGPATLTITQAGDHLSVAVNGQQLELFAEAQDKFFMKVADVQIEFVREAGKIKAVILKPGDVRAERQ